MPGRQQTFELVPTTLAHTSGARPPMTSKQAKKAYAAKNKASKMSRAERARLEKEELEAQRKERDRERAVAKAKAAREKKAAKEEEERDRRRKAGLPLKDVRPSQPTLAGFTMRVPKRAASDMMGEETGENNISVLKGQNHTGGELENYPACKKQAQEYDDDDEFGKFPEISPQTAHTMFSPVNDNDITVSHEAPYSSKQPRVIDYSTTSCAKDTPMHKETCIVESEAQSCLSQRSDDEFGDFPDLSPDELPRLFVDIKVPAESHITTSSKPSPAMSHSSDSSSSHGHPAVRNSFSTKPSILQKANSETKLKLGGMGPPPIPCAQLRAPLRAVSSNIPLYPAHNRSSQDVPPNSATKATIHTLSSQPISSTQAFLEENIEDFFPTPSQQVRELMQDVADFDIPSNTQVAREITNSQEPQDQQTVNTLNATLPFSTQMLDDFELSSQDLRDIETPSKPPIKPVKVVKTFSHSITKRRFFEKKNEDLLYAAIDESRKMAKTKEQAESEAIALFRSPAASQETSHSLTRVLSNNTDYGDDFDACSEELLDALAQADGKVV